MFSNKTWMENSAHQGSGSYRLPRRFQRSNMYFCYCPTNLHYLKRLNRPKGHKRIWEMYKRMWPDNTAAHQRFIIASTPTISSSSFYSCLFISPALLRLSCLNAHAYTSWEHAQQETWLRGKWFLHISALNSASHLLFQLFLLKIQKVFGEVVLLQNWFKDETKGNLLPPHMK